MDSLEYVKDKVKRNATQFEIGGFKPSGNDKTSWFGKVSLSLPEEGWPTTKGKPMHALCQINITQLPFIPEQLKDIEFITIFIGPDKLPYNNSNGEDWCLRAYAKIEDLVSLIQIETDSNIKQFEMKPILIEGDYPCWDDFSELQLKDDSFEIYEDVEDDFSSYFENISGFKIGGWPTLIQSEIFWAPYNRHPAKPEYVFQIDTTEKGNWMWGDNGVGYFGRGTNEGHTDVWTIEWQCF